MAKEAPLSLSQLRLGRESLVIDLAEMSKVRPKLAVEEQLETAKEKTDYKRIVLIGKLARISSSHIDLAGSRLTETDKMIEEKLEDQNASTAFTAWKNEIKEQAELLSQISQAVKEGSLDVTSQQKLEQQIKELETQSDTNPLIAKGKLLTEEFDKRLKALKALNDKEISKEDVSIYTAIRQKIITFKVGISETIQLRSIAQDPLRDASYLLSGINANKRPQIILSTKIGSEESSRELSMYIEELLFILNFQHEKSIKIPKLNQFWNTETAFKKAQTNKSIEIHKGNTLSVEDAIYLIFLTDIPNINSKELRRLIKTTLQI